MATKEAIKVVTGEVRLSYPSLFQPRLQMDGSTEKYECTLLISKKDKKTIKAIEDAIEKAKEQGKNTTFGGSTKGVKVYFRDGDEEREGEEFEDCMFLAARSKYAPVVVDRARQPILDASEIYPGCYGRVSINVYPYASKDANGKIVSRGVGFGLNAVQKTRDGERLGGNYVDPEAEFDELEDDDIFD